MVADYVTRVGWAHNKRDEISINTKGKQSW